MKRGDKFVYMGTPIEVLYVEDDEKHVVTTDRNGGRLYWDRQALERLEEYAPEVAS